MVGKRTKVVSEAQWNALVDRIYDAAIDAGLWPDVLLELGAPVRSHAAQLVIVGGGGTETLVDIAIGFSRQSAAAEFEELVSRGEQLRVNHAATIEPFQPMYDYQHTSEEEMKCSLFYQEHAIPLNGAYYAGTVLERIAESFSAVVHFRSQDAGHFSPEEIDYLMRLAPHVYRSIRLSSQASEHATIRCVQSLMASLRCAAIVVDARSTVVATNELADQMLAENDGLCCVARRLCLDDSKAGKALRREISGLLARDAVTTSAAVPRVLARRPSGRSPLRLFVCPLHRDLEPLTRPLALVLVLNPERSEDISARRFADEVGLTPTEAGVASLLASGHSVQEIAAMRRCRRDTVRSHVKRVLAKAGCRRQAELVALVLRSSQVPLGANPNS
jgi:DNA-binding CsgD family transcriptional regulator